VGRTTMPVAIVTTATRATLRRRTVSDRECDSCSARENLLQTNAEGVIAHDRLGQRSPTHSWTLHPARGMLSEYAQAR
jgi:hypothetical protein